MTDHRLRAQLGASRERPNLPFIIGASSVGTLIEWYDFYLYGVLAVFFSKHFFSPALDPGLAFILSLFVFWTGFLVRPFGAIVFGHLGDLIGRKFTFMLTLLLMGAATFVVGLLPGYETIGVLAPILLVAMRVLQGLALGGEYGGAATYIAEHAPDGRRGFYTSWIQTTATMGIVFALLVILMCRLGFGEPTFADWGWRVPFLISAVLVILSIYIRLKLEESPLYARLKDAGQGVAQPGARKLRQRQELGPDPDRAVRRHRARGRGLVHRPVLRAVLHDDGAEGRLRHGLHHHDDRADRGGAVLYRVRRAVGPDRPPQHHDARLRARGRHVLAGIHLDGGRQGQPGHARRSWSSIS